MKAKAKSIIGIVIGIVFGYVIGAFLGLPTTSGNAGQGNISKVSKYHSVAVNPAMSAFQEKLQNDSTELAKTTLSLTVLTSRMNEFSELVNIASDAADGNEALKAEIETLKTVQRIADNAVNAGRMAVSSIDGMVAGTSPSSANEYEQASQNLTVAYLMVDRQMQVAKHFVAAVDDFFKKNSVEQNVNLAAARDLWASYCEGNAVINNDEEELSYWQKKNSSLSGEQVNSVLDSIGNNKLIASLQMDAMLGLVPQVEGFQAFQQLDLELGNKFPWVTSQIISQDAMNSYPSIEITSKYIQVNLESIGQLQVDDLNANPYLESIIQLQGNFVQKDLDN